MGYASDQIKATDNQRTYYVGKLIKIGIKLKLFHGMKQSVHKIDTKLSNDTLKRLLLENANPLIHQIKFVHPNQEICTVQ